MSAPSDPATTDLYKAAKHTSSKTRIRQDISFEVPKYLELEVTETAQV